MLDIKCYKKKIMQLIYYKNLSNAGNVHFRNFIFILSLGVSDKNASSGVVNFRVNRVGNLAIK
jgi:hypothetical protein